MTVTDAVTQTGTDDSADAADEAAQARDAQAARDALEALDALGGLAEQVFGDLDVEASRSPSGSTEAVSDEHDRNLWRTLAETGILGAVLPVQFGGGDVGVPGMVRILMESGSALARVPLVETFVAATVIAEAGSPIQGEKLLSGVAAGELVITAALAESAEQTAHPLTLQDGRLRGITHLVPYPLSSDLVLVPAVTVGGVEVLALVSLSTARIGDQVTTTGEPLGVLEFIDVEVTDVFHAAPRARQLAALFSAAALCGIGAKALAMTADYVSGRSQFGHPLATFQGVALRAADRYIDSRAMQAACWEAARHLSGPDRDSLRAGCSVATAKIWAADGARRITASAQHLHGGFGVDVTYPLHRYHAWARYWELYGGSAAAWSAELGDLIATAPIEEDE